MKTLTKTLLLFLTFSTPAYGDELECIKSRVLSGQDGILQQVEKAYKSINVVQAKFSQRSYFAGLDTYSESTGELRFKKPGKMDWMYDEPDSQRFISDGKTLWFYQKDDNQVTLADFDSSFKSDLPVTFLLGVGEVSESFKLSSACITKKGIKLDLSAKKSQGDMQSFSLFVREDDFIPVGATIVDLGGSETTILFNGLEVNSELTDEYFEYKIPRGVDIIDKRSAH